MRFLIEGRLADQAGEHLPVEAIGARFIIGDGAAGLALKPLQLGLIGIAIGIDGNIRISDLGEIIGAEAAKNIAYAPYLETQYDEAHDHGHDGASEPGLGGGAHAIEHEGKSPLMIKNGEPVRRSVGRAYRRRLIACKLRDVESPIMQGRYLDGAAAGLNIATVSRYMHS